MKKPLKIVEAVVSLSYGQFLLWYKKKAGYFEDYESPDGSTKLMPKTGYADVLNNLIGQESPVTVETFFHSLYGIKPETLVPSDRYKITEKTEWFLYAYTGINESKNLPFSQFFWLKSWKVSGWSLVLDVLDESGVHQTWAIVHFKQLQLQES